MINTIIIFFQNNWDSILAIITSVIALATAIVKITPTQKDDTILQKIIDIFEKLSLVNSKKNQEVIEKSK